MIRERLRSDRGLGMTELAVAMIVLGVILVAILPLVVDSITMAAKNAEVAQANRIVAAQLDAARDGIGVACTAADTPTAVTTDLALDGSDGTTFTAMRVVSCDSARLAKVTVSVERTSNPGTVVATATTKVLTS